MACNTSCAGGDAVGVLPHTPPSRWLTEPSSRRRSPATRSHGRGPRAQFAPNRNCIRIRLILMDTKQCATAPAAAGPSSHHPTNGASGEILQGGPTQISPSQSRSLGPRGKTGLSSGHRPAVLIVFCGHRVVAAGGPSGSRGQMEQLDSESWLRASASRDRRTCETMTAERRVVQTDAHSSPGSSGA